MSIFNLSDIPKSTFEKFVDFIKENPNFNEIRKYYDVNKLHLVKGQPVVYSFESKEGKLYIGKANDLFQRLKAYIDLKTAYVNTDLKDDLMVSASDFNFKITTEWHNNKITTENILDAENWFIANNSHRRLYNKTNIKLKTNIRQAAPAKNLKAAYKKLDKSDPDKFKGFDMFD